MSISLQRGAAALLVSLLFGASAQADVFPGSEWAERTPAQAGLDAAVLDDLADLVGGSGMIVREGYKVYEWGSATTEDNWASAGKPLLSTLLFMADDEGRCSLDSPIGNFLGGGTVADSSISFFHLSNMISGYSRAEGPGEAWAYNDRAINLFGYVLSELVFDDNPSSLIVDRFSFLGFEDAISISNSKFGRVKSMTIRDFARLGHFWLNRGHWDGVQVIPDGYFDYVTNQVPPGLPVTAANGPESWDLGTYGGDDNQTPVGPGHYGMAFWVNTNGFLPGLPADIFLCSGHWGEEVCVIVPSMRLVAAGLYGDWGHPPTEAVELLLDAEVSPAVSASAGVESDTLGRIKARYR